MISKIALLVVSIMVVVGVIITVSVFVGSDGRSYAGPYGIGCSMKMVTSICELTKYKGPCARSLEPAAKKSGATSKDYILAVLEATLNELNESAVATSQVDVDKAHDKDTYRAVEDCKEFLNFAGGRLRNSIAIVNEQDDLNKLDEDQKHELLTWSTAVYGLHTSCLDPIDDPVPKSSLQKAIQKSAELSHNAVNIMAELPKILTLFNENAKGKKLAVSISHSRSLISEENSNTGGYPTWFNAADRKLVEHVSVKADVVVAADGTGQFETIAEAIAAYPANHTGRFTIHVKAGDYKEQVLIDKNKPNIFMYGDGIGKTIVTGRRNYGIMKVVTMHTATYANEADGVIVRGMTFRNKAGQSGLQAVAFRSMGDRVVVFDCSIEGFQDTLFYQLYRQFYRNCLIYGTIDFIFGRGEAVIQDSQIIVRKPLANQINTVTADGKEIPKGSNGLVLQNCRIVPEKALFPARFQIPTYLGRPWMPEALTVVMQSELGDFIRPEGWVKRHNSANHKTCHMFEYANRGPGAQTNLRNREFANFKVLDANGAATYTLEKFQAGAKWLTHTGVPFRLGL